jgi:CheY-like chemotaxis protein
MHLNNNRNIILCVDDDPDDLELLQHALKSVGSTYSIIEAHDGEDALTKLREMKKTGTLPCLVVLDINMPKIDGKQTLVSIQSDKELSSVPVVIFTTSSSAMDKMFFEKRNVEFITKPVNFDTFYNVASRLLTFCK